jgi:hypothetical protein
MDGLSRRALLRGGAGALAGAAVLGGPFRGFVALAEGAPRAPRDRRELGPIPDLRDGAVRLWLPAGFQYRSFHDTELDDAYQKIQAAIGATLGDEVQQTNELTWQWAAIALVLIAISMAGAMWWLRGMV